MPALRSVQARIDAAPRGHLVAVVLLTIGAIGAYVALLLWAPARFMGVDDAYYLGIGANLFAGRGLATAFGGFPSVHSPLWPIVLTAPDAWFGVDPSRWGHVLVVLSGATIIGLTAWFAGRAVRIAGPLAAAVMIAFPVLLDLSRGQGLDLPSAALAMLYVGLGIVAIRRGSLALGLMAGLVLAVAFLVKELVLPFAPVPLLAGLLRPTSLAAIGRASAGILLAAMVGTSWWFLVDAAQLGIVYRLGTPAWTLIPLALLGLALVLLGLNVERIARRGRWPAHRDAGRWRAPIGWLGAVAWAVILTVYFARTPTPFDAGFLVPAQVVANLSHYGPVLWAALAFGLVGGSIAIVDRIRPSLLVTRATDGSPSEPLLGPDDPHAVDDLLLALLCGLPFVALVISIGEGPRHYVAHLGFLVALGSIGWTRLLIAIARQPRWPVIGLGVLAGIAVLVIAIPFLDITASWRGAVLFVIGVGAVIGLVVVGLRRADARARSVPSVAAGAVLLVALVVGGAVMIRSVPRVAAQVDVTRSTAVATVVDWARERLPAGSTIVFGSGLAMETAMHLDGLYRTAQVRDEAGIHPDPSGALGLGEGDRGASSDWVALWPSPTDVTSFNGYRAGVVVDAFTRLGPAVWIQTVTTTDGETSPMLDLLSHAEGVTELSRWSWPYGSGKLETVAYRVDPTRLAFPSQTVLSPAALERIVTAMEADPVAYRAAARSLASRVVLAPGAQVQDLLDRLRSIAGPE